MVTLFQADWVVKSAGHQERVGMGNLGYTIMMIGVFVGIALVLRGIQYLADRHGRGAGDPEPQSAHSPSPARQSIPRPTGTQHGRR